MKIRLPVQTYKFSKNQYDFEEHIYVRCTNGFDNLRFKIQCNIKTTIIISSLNDRIILKLWIVTFCIIWINGNCTQLRKVQMKSSVSGVV